MAAASVAILFRDKPKSSSSKQTHKPRRRRWRWPFHRNRIPWQLGRVTIDLRGGDETRHAVVAGMSGTGKSTAVVPLLEQPGPALVVAFDNSRPIRDLFEARGWTIWQPGGPLGWDILSGPSQIVSEALVAGMPESASSMQIMSGMAQERIWDTLDELDVRGQPRTIDALVAALSVRRNNQIEDRACLDWAVRFRRIAKSLGRSLGNDLDLAEAMLAGDKVLILPNRFLSPRDAPLVGAMALVQARRVAQEVGNFLLVVEEAGQAGARQIELNALAQAGRDRGCPLIVITQNMAKLPEEVVNNVKVWISFAQESSKELAFAAERLRIESLELQDDAMPTGYAWVRSPDVGPHRAHLKLPRFKRRPSYEPGPMYAREEGPTERRSRTIIEEITAPAPVLALGMPPLRVRKVLDKIDRTQGDCWLWLGTIDDDGYGVQHWKYPDNRKPNNRPAHQVVWELVNGRWFPQYEDGSFWDWDHRRTCPRHCVNPGHGEPTERGENARRRWRVRGVGSPAAD